MIQILLRLGVNIWFHYVVGDNWDGLPLWKIINEGLCTIIAWLNPYQSVWLVFFLNFSSECNVFWDIYNKMKILKFTLNLSMSGSDGDSNIWTSWFLSSRWRPMWDSSDTWLLNENGSNSILAGVTMVTALHSNSQLCSLFIVVFDIIKTLYYQR